jgi:HTH-type transcriptional regulator/antitoxin HigA
MNPVSLRPIRNEQEYREALAQIDLLVDASEGSPEFDRLEVLSVLVADYEDKHHAIEAPDPRSFLEYVMESEERSETTARSPVLTAGERAPVAASFWYT